MTTLSTFEPDWRSLQQYCVPGWFQDAKLGIFIHWGIYSVPALMNEWYPRHMYQKDSPVYEHHRATYGKQTVFGYKDFIPLFRAERFDPAAWVELFVEAGAKYIVPVAEHHDGFPMYATRLTRWNAADMGPRRDVIGELAEAARRVGLVLGVSSHRAEHWWYLGGGREFPSDVQDPAYADFYGPAHPAPDPRSDLAGWNSNDWSPRPDAAFLDDWLARTCELVDRFQPQLIYFDWWIHQLAFEPYLQKFAAYYYNRVSGAVITYKLDAFAPGTAVFDVERGQLADICPQPWQTCTSVSKNSWGYIRGQEYKEPAAIIHHLVDIVSKNGCMLLNVGPKSDGVIPDEEQYILRQVGRWLAVNGEAIYGTRPWRTFGEGPTRAPEGGFNDAKISFTAADIRFTTKGNALYAILLGAPGNVVEIRSFGMRAGDAENRVQSISLLGSNIPLSWSQDETGLRIQIPHTIPGEHAWVLKITHADDRW